METFHRLEVFIDVEVIIALSSIQQCGRVFCNSGLWQFAFLYNNINILECYICFCVHSAYWCSCSCAVRQLAAQGTVPSQVATHPGTDSWGDARLEFGVLKYSLVRYQCATPSHLRSLP
jgi:hypothetical protein